MGDKVYLKISAMKVVMRFGKKGKLRRRYVGPYEVRQRDEIVAYILRLPSELTLVHPVFHIFMLKKSIGDTVSILLIEGIEVDDDLSCEEVSIEILDR